MFTPQQPEKPGQNGSNPTLAYTGSDAEDFYYTEEGFIVFTAGYHLKRGYCCRNGCRHCPYGFKKSGA